MSDTATPRDPIDSAAVLACPLPIARLPARRCSAHGGGGRLTQQLIETHLRCRRSPTRRSRRCTTAPCSTVGGPRSPSPPTRSSCSPLFFPGGDIGSLAVHGTVNDLAMCGAQPAGALRRLHPRGGPRRWTTCGGSSASMAAAARGGGRADRHRRHQGRGPRQGRRHLHQHHRDRRGPAAASTSRPHRAPPGRRRPDQRRRSPSTASRSCRCARGCEFEHARSRATPRRCTGWSPRCSTRVGDARPRPARPDARRRGERAERDRRGRAASASARRGARSRSREEVRGACEILGLDPLYVANEGKVLAFVAPRAADEALAAMRAPPARPRGGDHRRGGRRAPRPGRAAQPDRRHARRRHADRRAAAADLLSPVADRSCLGRKEARKDPVLEPRVGRPVAHAGAPGDLSDFQ